MIKEPKASILSVEFEFDREGGDGSKN